MKTQHKVLLELLKAGNHKSVTTIIDRVAGRFTKISGYKYTLYLPKKRDNEIIPLMVSHTDTVSNEKPKGFTIRKGVVSNPKGVLGADDRAGCYGLYRMMEAGVEAFYLFTDEEEIGGVGAKVFSKSDDFDSIKDDTSALIELDRRGSNDIATYGCDNAELIGLFEERGYAETWGSYTDVVDLSEESAIACINLSIGYYHEHTKKENLNLVEMQNTIDMMIEDMPEELYTTKFEYEEVSYNYTHSFRGNDLAKEVVCDVCGQHEPLYEISWGYVCKECLNYEYELDWS